MARSNRSAFKILDFDDYNISGTITTTETSFVPVGNAILALLGKGNGNLDISYRFGDIRPKAHSPKTRYFFILILIIKSFANFVRNNFFSLQRSYRSAFEIHDFDDYNISEMITTTETWFVPVGSMTLGLA